jgi:glyine---[glycyl-carrier protein] ligase
MSTPADSTLVPETAAYAAADALAFWRERMAGTSGGLTLPGRSGRTGPGGSGAGSGGAPAAHHELAARALPGPVTEALRAIGESAGVGAVAVVLAGLRVVLARFAGTDDVVVWLPLPVLAGVAGLPVLDDGARVLPVRGRYDGGDDIRTALTGLRDQAREAYRYRRAEPAHVVPAADGDRTVRVAFTATGAAAGDVALADLVVTCGPGTPVTLAARFRPDVLAAGAVGRLMDGLQALLAAAVERPDREVGTLPVLPAAERARIVHEWSGRVVVYPDGPLVHDWVGERAAAAPRATAVVHGERRLTYRELDERANQLAHRLHALGAGAGTRVALCLDRSPEMVVGMLAALRAGAAYLPVDPGYPAPRLAFLLADAQPAVLLTDATVGARLPGHGVPTVELDPGWARLTGAPTSPPRVDVAADDLAYVIYTSGSTGQPKGVELRHDGLLNLVRWHHDAYRLGPDDRTTQLAGTAFDASVWEIWPTLAAGATLYLSDAATQGSAADLVRWLVRQAITVAFLPTPLAELVLDEAWPAECALRYLLTGGDRLHRYPPTGLPFTLVNHYGPTESTVVTTAAPVPPRDGDTSHEPPIGRPIANTRVYLLDQRMQPVPVGVAGELYIGGAGLARGYLNRPDLTRERFVPDPFAGPGRLYRTGDLARWRPDGEIEFLGRNDEQVKLRGFRIEPGEIETVLRGHPGLAEAAVVLREDTPGHPQLVGYLVPRPGSPPAGGELRRWLGTVLPEYLVPSAFVELDALPLTRNGKLDRAALPPPDQTRPADLGDYVPPRDGVESALASLWGDLLGVHPVGAGDDFFALGGSSLAATRLTSRVRDLYGVSLQLSSVFAEPTVRGLAGQIERSRTAGDDGATGFAIPRVSRAHPQPLSQAQAAMWLLDRLDVAGITYNVPIRIELRGSLDVEALRAALTGIVARHESLRTRFPVIEGSPAQVVAEPFEVDLPVVVLDGAVDPDAWLVDLARGRFDLAAGPPLRFALLRRAADEHVLLLVVHHIAFDGWSLGVFCRELGEGYAGRLRGVSPPAPPAVQCVDVAAWQREQFAAQPQTADVAYWRERLTPAPPALDLPTDFAAPARPSDEGARTQLMLDRSLTERISAFSRVEGVTVFMTLLAAFVGVLSRYSGSLDVVVGSPVAGRVRSELEPLVGCFINTLPLRVDLSGEPGFRQLLARVRAVALGAYQHQNLPLERIVEAVRPERVAGQAPLYRVVFAFEDAHDAEFSFAGIRASVAELDFGRARVEFGLSVTPVSGALRVCAEYRTELFTEPTVRGMLEAFATLLAGALAEPGRPVATLPLIPAPRLRRMLVDWNDTAAPYPHDACLHELVERRVDAAPDALAVVFEDEARLTYRELDERANRLAHHLRELGVRPSSRVAVCLHRSPEMVVAVLAVLKAGGAYLPLDPANPADRLGYMMSDAAVPVVLTASGLRERLPSSDASVVELDRDWPAVARRPATRPPRTAGPRDLAYVIYTSGSTGRPKGVMIEHHSVANFLVGIHHLFQMGPHDDVLQFASLGFDVSVFEIFSALTAGARLHLARQETLLSVRDLTRFMRQHRISVTDIPPAVMTLLDGDAFPDLRIAFVGCEAYSGSLVNDWVRPGRRFFNGYGPTEATVTVIVEECVGNDWRASPPIGRPMWNVQAYVLDHNGQPVPPGVPGELHLGGVCLARGYLNQPELTARKFIANPFVDDPAARLYKTGDLVRQLPDGRLEFLGRIDSQVKLRGLRIELGEIEVALRQYPPARDAVVVLRADAAGQRQLVAYVLAGEGARPEPARLRAHLARTLPPYMVPAAFVVLDAFPLNPSGKVDRAALPAPEAGAHAAGNETVAPRNRRERSLVEIWMRLLREANVGIHDNFFALGGHSILAVQLVWEVHKAFGVEISIRDVFDRPTVAELAEVVEAAMLALLDRAGGVEGTGSAGPDGS